MRQLQIISCFAMVVFLLSCAYENKEDLGIGQVPCEITEATYAIHILPILEDHCIGCHQPGFAQGGIDLVGYDLVKQSVDDGSFLGSIVHDPDYSIMPPDGQKIPKCEIETIEFWMANGALNN